MTDPAMIVRVAALGDGVSGDGRHVPLAAPGDIIRANGSIAPGPHHQTPPCRHFPHCGGCELQHLDEESYAQFVVDRVEGALAGQGLEATIRAPTLSPPHSRRRATLHAERRGSQIVLGYAEAGSHALIDLAECPVLHRDLADMIKPLRRLLGVLMTGKRRVDVHLSLVDQGVDMVLIGVEAAGLVAAEAISAFGEKYRIARLAIDDRDRPEIRWEPEAASVTLGGAAVPVPPGAFLQATEHGEAALVAAVREMVGTPATMADLFAGMGTFALGVAPRAKVYAAEASRDAILALKSAAARAGRLLVTEHRDLYRRPLTVAELNRFEAIVLDPPRAGAREQAEALAECSADVIAYVSCNPSSFARDAKVICAGGFQLDWVQPVGQFRWSTHVELVGRFRRPAPDTSPS
ncbi:MAG: class I SAM-dependent RNA methyltransferase [Sphingomonas sp.]